MTPKKALPGVMRSKILISFIFFLLWISCAPPADDKSDQSEKESAETFNKVNVPEFNPDSAYFFIEQQVQFGPRVPNTAAHTQTAKWMVRKLEEYGLNVIVQEAQLRAFDNTVLNAKNIIAEHKPEMKERILLFAHWDTRPYADQDTKDRTKPIDGANDGGSGVGVLLEIARVISQQPPNIGIDIILFDVEDYGQPDGTMMERKPDTYALGSQHWSKNKHRANYSARFGILLDMVGARDAKFTKEGTSMYFAPNVVEKVWRTAETLGYGDFFIDKKTPMITDDHYYVNQIAGIPSIDIIQYDSETRSGFGHYWHTHQDNMDVIDKNTLKAVGQTVTAVIYQERP
jgi:glutaminyl-peptide cyclotransferase